MTHSAFASSVLALVWLAACPGCASPPTLLAPEQPAVLIDADGVALGGYDPVAYFTQGEARRGQPDICAPFAGATYHFENAAQRDTFALEPERYVPAFGGWCAWALARGDGALVEVEPRSFLVQGGRLLLFFDGPFADTRAKWLRRDHESLLARAERNWSRILRREDEG